MQSNMTSVARYVPSIYLRSHLTALKCSPPPSAVFFDETARNLSAENRERGVMGKNPESQNHQKTVLVVDDDEAILKLISTILVDRNYKVLTAASGSAALEKSRDSKDDIHLLLSDFQMPGMNGIDLATQMTRDRPDLKVLLMSTFPDGMLVLNEGWHYLTNTGEGASSFE
jgi:PleD family two-component response regulator